nr:hypothetical protein [Tanacetum cinerariifolium]
SLFHLPSYIFISTGLHHHSPAFTIFPYNHSTPFTTIPHRPPPFPIVHHHSLSFTIILHRSPPFPIVHHHSPSSHHLRYSVNQAWEIFDQISRRATGACIHTQGVK